MLVVISTWRSIMIYRGFVIYLFRFLEANFSVLFNELNKCWQVANFGKFSFTTILAYWIKSFWDFSIKVNLFFDSSSIWILSFLWHIESVSEFYVFTFIENICLWRFSDIIFLLCCGAVKFYPLMVPTVFFIQNVVCLIFWSSHLESLGVLLLTDDFLIATWDSCLLIFLLFITNKVLLFCFGTASSLTVILA